MSRKGQVAHPYQKPRPEGVYYGPPYNDPQGSMFWYRNVYRLHHKLMQLWPEWGEAKPVECINFVRTELCYPPESGDQKEGSKHA